MLLLSIVDMQIPVATVILLTHVCISVCGDIVISRMRHRVSALAVALRNLNASYMRCMWGFDKARGNISALHS